MSESALRVEDEENFVATERKKQILGARENVRDWREELFTAARTGEIDEESAVTLFGDPVREYLMTIEPLLQLDLSNAQEVYEKKELGTIELRPPEEYLEAAGGRQSPGRRSEKTVSGDLDVKTYTIEGLKEVIERESVSATWTIHIKWARPQFAPRGGPRQTVQPTVEKPLTREVLRNAVRTADQWLQEAGVGLDLDAEPYRSEEPGL